MSIICTICARGGSKGIVNKNLKLLLGKPLVAHSILQAKASNCCDRVVVSSDSHDIREVAAQYGADLIIERPAELATDDAPKIPAIRHCVETAEKNSALHFDTILDLDPTSPLRNVGDIQAAMLLFRESRAPNIISGTPARRSPWFNLAELLSDGSVALAKTSPIPINRRQDAPTCFDLNASIYVYTRNALFNSLSVFHPGTRMYVMPEERSLDIDSDLDFELVTYLAEKRGVLL